jgi:UDP-N-acetylglucosamine transferase subunit ALG13
VVTGIHEHGFDRLVEAVDRLVEDGVIDDVFIQTGFSEYQPKNCPWSKTVDYEEFEKRIDEADIIISHGGAGCIAGALERNKPTIVVPRLKKYNEHNNDHQLELTSALEKSGRILAVYDIKNLYPMIKKANGFKPSQTIGDSQIVNIIRNFLLATAQEKGKNLKSPK